jgi:hypothetical protein
MRLTDVNDFFKGKLALESFKTIIEKEVILYKQNLQKRGSSVPISLIEDSDLSLDSDIIYKLCKLYLSNEISDYELYYISDAMLLSSRVIFKNEKNRDILELLTDPEVNGPLTANRIKEILETLDIQL